MRKLKIIEHISLDGVMQSSGGDAGTRIGARRHESHGVGHHSQYLQSRGAFKDRLVSTER